MDDQGSSGAQPAASSGGFRPTFENIREIAAALRASRAHSQGDDLALRDEILRQDLELHKVLADQTRARTEQLRHTRELREKYAERVYKLLRWWIFAAIVLLVLDAFNPPAVSEDSPWIYRLILSFDVDTPVMLGFLGGTTVAVVGLVLAVVKGLFPGSSKD